MVAANHLFMRMRTSPATSHSSQDRTLLEDSSWLSRFDRTQVLGTLDDEQAGALPHYGHTGCVNALGWSADGTMLVSGSDDFRLCIWRMGREDGSSERMRTGNKRGAVYLGLGLDSVIHTGHRRNIFSAKFAPHTNARIFSCAGDHQVRVFETERATSSTYARGPGGRAWTEYNESQACVRVFRCHSERAKRIALEGSPDVFLTCAEDGTVRQHDLRSSHSCTPATRGRSCPTPLADYSGFHMGLYSLTVSQARPDVFVVAGTSPYAFLHDRRMSRRTMQETWGMTMKGDLPTQCVRRFGLPSLPPTDDEHTSTTAFRRRLLSQDKHVTATKLSNVNGRDLLVSYSGDSIYRYDILSDPEGDEVVPPTVRLSEANRAAKRKRPQSSESTDQVPKRAMAPPTPAYSSAPPVSDASSSSASASAPIASTSSLPSQTPIISEAERQLRRRIVASLALTSHATTEDPIEALSLLDELDSLNSRTEGSLPCRAYAHALLGDPDPSNLEILRAGARKAVKAEGWARERSRRREAMNYEVSIGDDGEVQVIYGGEEEEQDSGSEGEELDEPMYLDTALQDALDEDDEEEEEEEDDDDDDEPYLRRVEALRKKEAGVHNDVPVVLPLAKYSGHRNVDTVKDVNFAMGDEHIVSGSDDGRFFCWNKRSGELEGIWNGDSSVVNVLKCHPHLPVMAISGIDDTIKMFGPTSAEQKRWSCLADAESIIARNNDQRNQGRGMIAPSAQMLLQLLSERMETAEEADDGSGVRRINVQGEDCIIS